ncbi:probable E3 ubiquitin-protein ligase TRIML2 isoform X1 [Diceros bicornis minor]|uniref:probable E3 ubiquitin-protein ligase TRIML2 isoform X1 n=1 Tax=Diceros bicornis minor TaxID=77932 RepID=UPI0026F16475|nr:probable E3 ubiquitin-protein ligase TRIML2 isoform X1 [Diceros bicornis minor]XP_058381008.1 probable E3 ubiquitin-protein ligase TRIML2 isoform X1 [Diceros bicornis minor]
MSKRLSPHLQQKIPEGAYCEKHLEPLQLFCDDDQIALCAKCLQSQEHTHHMVYGVQEAAENYRRLFREISNVLKEKLEVAKSMLADEQERMVMIQEEEQNFKEMIESEYRIMFRLMIEENEVNFQSLKQCVFNLNLREASLNQLTDFATELSKKSQEMLRRLNDLERENMNKLKESEVRLSEQICSLQSIPAELEKCGESTLALLQNARYSLERTESLLLQCLQPARIADLSLCQITGMSKMLKVLQRPITLDPKTAHPCLVLSEDLRSIRLRNVQQDVPGNPERFDFSATVLGVESFTSGRHYWEVDVGKTTKWQLGIYEDSVSRKSDLPKASADKVLLTGSLMGADFTLWVFPPLRRVFLREQMHKVGVFLDYEYGQISFYDVTKRSLIYNFSCLTFQGALRPIFSLCLPIGGTNSDSLSICLPHVSSCNVTVRPQSSLV